ncbi:MAG: magnesium transporter [Pseudonocardiales bacterium]|nr:magnesium transporter [Pseudonocardiales bacterium]
MTTPTQTVFLSALLKNPVRDHAGRELGRLSDIIVTLPRDGYPTVTGLLLTPGDQDVFVGAHQIAAITDDQIELATTTVDLRPIARRDREVLLRADVLGHRLLDPDRPRLVRAHDVLLARTEHGWVVRGVDVHHSGLWQRLTDHTTHQARDWAAFDALIGHQASIAHRGLLTRLRGLKPAQIADLLEAANAGEQGEILAQVHADPELEADVFEELDDERQARLLATRTNAEIAAVLARMNADDAADALMDLPQDRRRPVLNALPEPQRRHVTTLLGYAAQTAGGLMSIDHLTLPRTATAADALAAVREARAQQHQALTTIYLTDPQRRLFGAVTLVIAVQATPDTPLEHIADADPVRVLPDTDALAITRLMADYNLLLLPVVDADNRILGAITVDDALEAAIPENWRQRQLDTPLTAHKISPPDPNAKE